MVVLTGFTIKLAPEPTSVPQQLPVYQSTVHPLGGVAVNVEDTPPQPLVGLAEGLVGAAGGVHAVIVIASKAPALFTVVTSVSRKIVIDVPVAVTLTLKSVQG